MALMYLLPAVSSMLALAAHFLRAGLFPLAVASLAASLLLLVPKA